MSCDQIINRITYPLDVNRIIVGIDDEINDNQLMIWNQATYNSLQYHDLGDNVSSNGIFS